jgi:hypothetical protein
MQPGIGGLLGIEAGRLQGRIARCHVPHLDAEAYLRRWRCHYSGEYIMMHLPLSFLYFPESILYNASIEALSHDF